MPDFCPQGFKKMTNYNGIAFCQACNISNCNDCADIRAKVLNVTAWDAAVAAALAADPV
jgi:hypothetical protein